MAAGRRVAAALGCAGLLAGACGGPPETVRPTRGVILISLGSVGATQLGAYGAARPNSPFLDRLAARGALFEHAVSPSPSTLTTHASLLTGLYPQQHGVSGPSWALPPLVETLPERFANFGYLTAGFTEGGLVGRRHGFHRGFDRFDDPAARDDTTVEQTFGRGLDFLRSLPPGQNFFLFLHTRSAGAPYEPPPPYDERYPSPAAPAAFEPTAANLRRAQRGFLAADAATAERFAALHAGGVAYLDSVLETFFAELDRLGLGDESTIVVTADHGEEFLEHGGLGAFQVYPETIRVPLLILHPELPARRLPGLVELVDIAPTLLELAALPPSPTASGRSLLPRLRGEDPGETRAWAEATGAHRQRTLLRQRGTALEQLVLTTLPAERDGTWISRRAALELAGEERVSVVSFERPRTLRLRLDGRDMGEIVVGTRWTPLDLGSAPAGRRRLELETDGCESPRELGLSDDPRCLALKLRGVEVRLAELFDLAADPQARLDIAAARPETRRELESLAAGLEWSLVAPPVYLAPGGEAEDLYRTTSDLD